MNRFFLIKIIHFSLLLLLTASVQLTAQTAADYAAMIKQQEAIEAQKQASIPKENGTKHIQAITTGSTIIAALATVNKQASFAKIDAVTKQQLTTLISVTKSSLADLGMMLFLQGPHGKDAATYLVCTA